MRWQHTLALTCALALVASSTAYRRLAPRPASLLLRPWLGEPQPRPATPRPHLVSLVPPLFTLRNSRGLAQLLDADVLLPLRYARLQLALNCIDATLLQRRYWSGQLKY